MLVQEPVKSVIWNCLNHYAYADAIFLAEHHFAEVGDSDALFILATAYYQSGKPKLAAVLLDNHTAYTPQCKLLHAQCLWDLKAYLKVEQLLTSGWTSKSIYSFKQKFQVATVIAEIQKEFGDSSCFVLSLLGRTYLKTERGRLAEQCLLAALKLNPLLWVCYSRMCEAGQKPDPQKIFAANSSLNINVLTSHSNSSQALKQPPSYSIQNKSANTRDSEPDSNILRTRQLQNRTNQPQQVSGIQPVPFKPPSSVEKLCLVNPDNMLTPPNIGNCDSLNTLPLSGFSQKDTAVNTPDLEIYRSTPADEWNSSIALTNSGMQPPRRKNLTQQKINRVLNSPSALSPISPRKTSSWTEEMVTRQSRKLNSGHHGGNPAFGKLHFSSENTNRRMPVGIANNANPLSKSSSTNQAVPACRSTRGFSNAGSAIKENTKHTTKNKHALPTRRCVKSRNGQNKNEDNAMGNETMGVTENQTNARNVDTLDGVLKVLRTFGESYLALCQYRCRDALACVDNVPLHCRKTGWVMSLIAKVHYEMNDYAEAAAVFKELRAVAPHYCKGLEIYSTALWHQQKDVELSSLAHDLQDLDRLCPETWCAVGNCFSLQRDHASAAAFFQRAIQLDPEFSYAYALLGHEKTTVEDFEGALTCYRSAIRWNPRLYSAWYGIGTIYYKQEKYKYAEIHFRKSLQINPRNSVLLCHIGIVQHALNRTAAACDTLETAVRMSPKNPLCKFHHANVLIAMERYEDAANELRELKEIVPKESLVYFLLGKVYKKLKQNHLAVICFSWAMDLDPKGTNNQIKEAINRQHLMDDDNDGMDADSTGLTADISHHLSSDILGGDHILTREGLLNRSSRMDETSMESDSDSLQF